MTSPGLKRPLDFELTSQTTDQTTSEGTTTASTVIKLTKDGQNGTAHDHVDGNVNGTKRRCTDTNFHQKTNIFEAALMSDRSDSLDASMQTEHQQQHHQHYMITPSPPYREPLSLSLDDELSEFMRQELYSSQQQINPNDNLPNGDGQIVLTARQLRSICVKLVSARERRLREEFDRKLASKLAEQYNLFAKANFLNTFSEPSRATTPATTTAPLTTTPLEANHPSLTNAIATALIHRSTTNPMLSPASSPNSVPSAATSMPNLTTIAATLTANSHHGALPNTHHLTAYNIQQHQAAAAAATAMRLAHHHHQQQQQQRISIPPIVSANGLIPSGPVLLASNLDDQLATPEALFTLFGVFGDVIRVKILFNKKDNALIQMADASRAQVAQSYLDKQRIFGKVIRVTRSKHQLVQMPRDGGQSDAGLTKDFTNSPLHRFKIPGSRNYLNIYPPSNTLHVSNIPATVDESDLHKAFKEQCGFEFSSFKFFPKDRKMALLKFNTVEHATIALIKMHNHQISDENNLRVSFSKSAL